MNKKALVKRLTCGILAAGMMLSLSACGGKGEVPLASKENVFTAQEIEIPTELKNISMVKSDGEYVYLYGSNDDSKELEDGNWYWSSETKFVVMDIEGNLISESVLAKSSSDDEQANNEKGYSENTNINNAALDKDGNFWALENHYKYVYESGESTESFNLVKYGKDGVASAPIDLSALKDQVNGDDYFYIGNFNIDNDGNIYVTCQSTLFVLDSTGKLLFKLESDVKRTDNSGSWLGNVIRTSTGKMFIYESQYSYANNEYSSKSMLKEIDVATQSFSRTVESKRSLDGVTDGAGEYDSILVTSSGMSGYNIETDTATPIIDWMRSGFDTTTMQCSTVLSDGRILCATYVYEMSGGGYSYGGDGMRITLLTRVAPEDVPDKKLITIACWYLDYDLRNKALEFNKNNAEYQIEIKSYMDESDWNDAITNLNNDLIAGNIPDVLIVANSMPVSSYISKGMFADIYKFMDADEEINKEDYLQNIFEACETDGKLYSIVPSFSIQTLAGKTSLVGEKQGWTVDEFIDFVNANPDKQVFRETTKSQFISNLLYQTINDYINYQTGVCNFNTPEFIKLLEFANTFPEEIDYETLYNDPNWYTDQQSAYRTDKVLLSDQYLNRFTTIRELEKGAFGEPITFKGYPTSDSTGSAAYANLNLAIMAKGKNTDGAWQFVRTFLQSDYQDKCEYAFPIKNSALEIQMEKAKEKPFYMDGDKKVEYENTYWLGESSIDIGVNDDADNQKILNFVKSVKYMVSYDSDLEKIITEETSSFFSGQKSAAEVADIIQNRVSVYINESR